MAKPFYSLEEVCGLLGKDADGVKELVRNGTLREFRDGGKVFFKAEDVDKLAKAGDSGKSGTGEIMLEAAPEEDELPSLADSGGGTSLIGLEAVEDEPKKDKEDTVITASGIGVFDEDELEIDADPMAKTQITSSTAGDQVSLEGTGSGSGLLDLTREADDTSLGAELLDEIYPGEEDVAEAPPKAPPPKAKAKPAAPVAEPPPAEEAYTPMEAGEVLAPVRAPAADPTEGIFAGLLVGALLLLALGGSVASSVLQGYMPDYALWLTNSFWVIFVPIAAGAVVVCLVVGWLLGRASGPRRG